MNAARTTPAREEQRRYNAALLGPTHEDGHRPVASEVAETPSLMRLCRIHRNCQVAAGSTRSPESSTEGAKPDRPPSAMGCTGSPSASFNRSTTVPPAPSTSAHSAVPIITKADILKAAAKRELALAAQRPKLPRWSDRMRSSRNHCESPSALGWQATRHRPRMRTRGHGVN